MFHLRWPKLKALRALRAVRLLKLIEGGVSSFSGLYMVGKLIACPFDDFDDAEGANDDDIAGDVSGFNVNCGNGVDFQTGLNIPAWMIPFAVRVVLMNASSPISESS